jgi:hypothetical protein
MPGKTRRRTRRTDSNGALKEVYREQWDREQLEHARRAGIPARMLDAAGSDDWRESGSVLGLWSELIYVLDDCLRGVDPLGNPRPDNLRIVEEVFDMMLKIAGGLGIESDNLIPWDVWYLRRDLSSAAKAEERTASEVQAAEDAKAAHMGEYSAVMGDWGCPSGIEHDNHSHGLTNGYWSCHKETK